MAVERDQILQGGCTCGAVRYRMTSEPMFVHCCHCRWCQRETGASFALNAMIDADRAYGGKIGSRVQRGFSRAECGLRSFEFAEQHVARGDEAAADGLLRPIGIVPIRQFQNLLADESRLLRRRPRSRRLRPPR